MSKKHLIALADTLARHRANLELCRDIAAICTATNPLFDRRRFLIACGFDPRDI